MDILQGEKGENAIKCWKEVRTQTYPKTSADLWALNEGFQKVEDRRSIFFKIGTILHFKGAEYGQFSNGFLEGFFIFLSLLCYLKANFLF